MYENCSLDSEDKNLILQLRAVNTKPSIIAKELNRKLERGFNRTKIKNFLNKMYPVLEDEKKLQLEDFIKK